MHGALSTTSLSRFARHSGHYLHFLVKRENTARFVEFMGHALNGPLLWNKFRNRDRNPAARISSTLSLTPEVPKAFTGALDWGQWNNNSHSENFLKHVVKPVLACSQ